MSDLTQRQREVLAYLTDAVRQDGRPPTLRELAAHFGWHSDNSARQHLRLLRQKGVIEYDEGVSRGIRLSRRGRAAELRQVPLVGRVAAGLPIEAIENLEGSIGVDPRLFPEAEIFALRVKGDSMTGIGIHDGDLAIVRKAAEARDQEVIVARLNGEATLKRLRRKNQAFWLQAENPAYGDIHVDRADSFEIVGIVVGIMRRLAAG